MPSNLQRLPAARARHGKRLPFQGWPDAAPVARDITGPITITQIIPLSTTSSNALTTSSAASSSPASSSSATPSPPPAAPSPPAAAPPAPPVVSQNTAPPTPIASAINPSKSATEGAQNNSGLAVSNPHGLPTGAVVGITIACVMLILGAFIFFIRQRAMRNRKMRRQTSQWVNAQRPMNSSFGEKPAAENMVQATPGASFALVQQAALAARSPGSVPTPAPVPLAVPASSYNNPILASVPAGSAANAAMVRYEFLPSLPDELSITTGEVVTVLSEYDDGWALCKNGRGDQGMVPLECIDRGAAQQTDTQDYRNSRRTSSLLRQGY